MIMTSNSLIGILCIGSKLHFWGRWETYLQIDNNSVFLCEQDLINCDHAKMH